MRWRRFTTPTLTIIVCITLTLISAPVFAAGTTVSRRHSPPSQGFYQMNAGIVSPIELRGLRVPLDIEPSHGRMLELAAYWATLSGAYLRVVSAMDHIHGKHSAHYSGDALDFQGQQLDDFAKWMRGWGFVVLYKVRGHWNHVHVQAVPLWHQMRYTRSRSH